MYLCVDIGGSKTRVASSVDLENFQTVEKFVTPSSYSNFQNLLKKSINIVTKGEPLQGICVGVPGQLDHENKKILNVPNIKYLSGVEFSKLIDTTVSVSVFNDACLASFGEAVEGSGKVYNRVAYITISTGVGGALITNKDAKCLEATYEPGHMIIAEKGVINNGCGQSGCFEAYCSGTSFEKKYGIKPENCNDLNIWAEYSTHLATGLTNVIAMWNPDVIVLGGSMINKSSLFLDSLQKNLCDEAFFPCPQIHISKFGDDSGLMGCMSYLKTERR